MDHRVPHDRHTGEVGPLDTIRQIGLENNEKLEAILLYLQGGVDKNSKRVVGLGEQLDTQAKRLDALEEFVASGKRLIVAIILGTATVVSAAWAMTGFGPHVPPAPHP